MGRIDQILRLTVSAVLLGLVLFGVVIDFTAGLFTAIAASLAITAAARTCPVFSLFGFTSLPLDKYMPYLIQIQSSIKSSVESLWSSWVGKRLTNR
ncbi:MAG TPA: DUF2892 domain-containing protein [Firmicutes bacterium]|nr:DUF2892 domain-containing protein [Bacillota bacterium]